MCFPRRNALRQIGPQLPRLCLSRRSAGMVDLMSLDPTNAIAPANNRKLTGPAGRVALGCRQPRGRARAGRAPPTVTTAENHDRGGVTEVLGNGG